MPIANRRKTTGSSKPKKMVPAKRKTTPKGKRSKASAKLKKCKGSIIPTFQAST